MKLLLPVLCVVLLPFASAKTCGASKAECKSNEYCAKAVGGKGGKMCARIPMACTRCFESASSQKECKDICGSAYTAARDLQKEHDMHHDESTGAMEPPLPGVMPGKDRPKVILAADVDWPPYAYIGDAEASYLVDGFGRDVAMGLTEVCDIDVHVAQTNWADCWGDNQIGAGLLNGYYHGCMTYTHTQGVRNRYLEFSDPILADNKPAGIITRLENGSPVVSGASGLDGLKVVDVIGWAPTSDSLALVTNNCTGEAFHGFEIISPTHDTGNANDDALMTLLDGTADAMWVYGDQAYTYACADGVDESWDCDMWEGLGTKFAYIHTGLFGHAVAGTTLAISKKGSGLSSILNPCIEAFLQTESYYNVCAQNGLASDCFPNEFFPTDPDAVDSVWKHPTGDLTTSCEDGYCACPV